MKFINKIKNKMVFIILLSILCPSISGASPIPEKKLFLRPLPFVGRGVSRESIHQALNQPLLDRLNQLKSFGPNVIDYLAEMAFDPTESFENRWRAVTAMGQIDFKKSIVHLEKAMTRSEWFLRNSALIAIAHGPREKALEWAKRLLKDKALVVRTAAVQLIGQLEAHDLAPLLWEQLNSKDNFKGSHSLWIRRHIVETLGHFARREDTKRFVQVLKDPDDTLHPVAISILEKMTDQSVAEKTDSISQKRIKWLAWSKQF